MQRTGEKWHAAVAKSTCASENGKKLTVSEHFLKFRCRKNCTPLWREAQLQVKMHKTPHSRSHFGSSDVQKWHAAVARSTFASENAQNTLIVGAILEVPMFKNATRLWREAHLQVKMHKTPHCRSYFGSSDVQKWHAAVARSTF